MVVLDQWQEKMIPIALSAGLARTRPATIVFYSSLLHMPRILQSHPKRVYVLSDGLALSQLSDSRIPVIIPNKACIKGEICASCCFDFWEPRELWHYQLVCSHLSLSSRHIGMACTSVRLRRVSLMAQSSCTHGSKPPAKGAFHLTSKVVASFVPCLRRGTARMCRNLIQPAHPQ